RCINNGIRLVAHGDLMRARSPRPLPITTRQQAFVEWADFFELSTGAKQIGGCGKCLVADVAFLTETHSHLIQRNAGGRLDRSKEHLSTHRPFALTLNQRSYPPLKPVLAWNTVCIGKYKNLTLRYRSARI